MAGRPGSGGPVPKRSTERRRRNKPAVEVDTAPAGAEPSVPEPDPEWHPIARDWFAALGRSGQSRFYEASDWATARYVAEGMSRSLLSGRLSAQLFAAVLAAATELLATEGSRRRMRLELERAKASQGDEQPAGVTAIDDYRRSLTS